RHSWPIPTIQHTSRRRSSNCSPMTRSDKSSDVRRSSERLRGRGKRQPGLRWRGCVRLHESRSTIRAGDLVPEERRPAGRKAPPPDGPLVSEVRVSTKSLDAGEDFVGGSWSSETRAAVHW